ncbi:hypothetical protein [Streptomyces sp. NPDC096068]|uniref:hypothetical protein n=1 Tax=Streptomyces sp. NPDC096068 TaxID=3155424 RepID=UPI00333108FB
MNQPEHPHRPPCTDGDHCGETAHCPPHDTTTVTVHARPDLIPAAAQGLEALVDVAVRRAREEAEPAQPRHTADTITDDVLTGLYDELAAAKQEADDTTRAATCLATLVGKRFEQAEEAAKKQALRAERAEAALARVRAVADEWAKTAQWHPGSRLATETVAYIIRTALDAHTTPTETT